jgi:hypothetical protein
MSQSRDAARSIAIDRTAAINALPTPRPRARAWIVTISTLSFRSA